MPLSALLLAGVPAQRPVEFLARSVGQPAHSATARCAKRAGRQQDCSALGNPNMLKTSTMLFALFIGMSALYRLFDGGPLTREFWEPTVGIAVASSVLTALLCRFVRKFG